MVIENMLENIVQTAPPFTVSEDLSNNISAYSMAVLLSSKIPSYKGNVPRDIVLSVLKKLRIGLPDNIEYIPADWAKVVSAVSFSLTQMRATIKKALIASLADDPKDAVHLFQLTRQLAAKANCRVTVPLCARVALMRHVLAVVMKGDTQDKQYWDNIDSYLKQLHAAAEGNPAMLARLFETLLKEDCEKYGKSPSFEVQGDVVDERQQLVDDVIEGVI
ncbi:hypothetical protein FA95DRAFT_1561433 [Auriscalpium vulgare]|uniref:Uncharacterized protein n=1 Tax=Auriscalpium vulgare TaxID=40419 RepID=A0ACB8RNQ7_9AGAM|nr:hypothetical protein FA95DRAFT_1561433 [Auriscalpium vulgare]